MNVKEKLTKEETNVTKVDDHQHQGDIADSLQCSFEVTLWFLVFIVVCFIFIGFVLITTEGEKRGSMHRGEDR